MKKIITVAGVLIYSYSFAQTQSNTNQRPPVQSAPATTTTSTSTSQPSNSNQAAVPSNGTVNGNTPAATSGMTSGSVASGTGNRDNWNNVYRYYDRMEANSINNYNLSQEQKNRIASFNKDYDSRVNSLYSDNSLSESELADRRNQLNQQRRNNYLSTLSPDDKKAYQSYLNDWNNSDINMDELKTNLSLTDEQVSKLQTFNNSYRERELGVINNNSFNDQQKGTQLKTIRDERASIYKTILSADQITKLEQKSNGGWKIKAQKGDQKVKIKTKPADK